MKKTTMILYAVIAVIAGILTGVLISSVLWKEEKVPNFVDIFTGDEKKNQDENTENNSDINRKKESDATQAKYKITDGQKYYTELVDKDAKNVLLVGEDDTSGNFDTVIVASVSEENKTITMINFPRDIYLDYSDEVLHRLKVKSPKLYNAKGFQKINAAHTVGNRIEYEEGKGFFENSNIDFLADIMNEVFMIPIDDCVYVNTKGFREVIDLFGGVDIEVPIRMKYEDPVQNLYIDLQKGMQHLNGEQSEWFVRFRQGYDENGEFKNYSDEFRKKNQNEFMKAFFQQHINLKNLGKVDDLQKLMSDNIRTSINGAQKITEYIQLFRKALSGKYSQQSCIIECSDSKSIDGVYFNIIRSK